MKIRILKKFPFTEIGEVLPLTSEKGLTLWNSPCGGNKVYFNPTAVKVMVADKWIEFMGDSRIADFLKN